MITLATDLVQQFYTHQQICDNQAILIKSFLKISITFLDKVISKRQIFFLDFGGQVRTAVSHTHTHLSRSVLNYFVGNVRADGRTHGH
jgi:hypothetical protein